MRIGVLGAGRIGGSHAATVLAQPQVDEVLVGDIDPARAADVADRIGARPATVDEVFGAGVDGLVIAAPTAQHADLILRAVDAGIPTFCEKPVADTVQATRMVVEAVERAGVPVQIGFQRRFDAGYRRLREAVLTGELGELRRVHLMTCDPAPPAAEYIATSGGIFRDCHVHDFDILRYVSGQEVTSVYATGSNRGAAFFGEAGDVDESVAILTLEDGTLATLHGSRYNGAGYDVRMEAAGTRGTWAAGLDDRSPLSSAEPGVDFPRGVPWPNFLERFAAAYSAELATFVGLVEGAPAEYCTPREAMAALLIAEAADESRRRGVPVLLTELRNP